MKKLSPNEKIDKVLEVLATDDTKGRLSFVTIVFKCHNVDGTEIEMILDKLIKDGYVSFEKFNGFAGTSIADSNEYLITFEGAVFYESAGYTGKLKNERAITRKLRIESMLLTYGTLGAGLYGVFEIAKWALHHFHRHLPF